MDTYTAVFNSKKSDLKSGKQAVLSQFGKDGYNKVKKINRTGVMAMFMVEPTPETILYAKTVADSVREREQGKA